MALLLLATVPSSVGAALPAHGAERLRAPSPLDTRMLAQRNRAEQWQKMAPAEKETMRRRMEQWNQMPPQDRQRYEKRYEQWKHLSPDEQRKIDGQLKSWQDLSPAEKEGVRRKFR